MINTITAIVTLLIWGSAAWVYWDATEKKIGKIPGEKGFLNMSAGSWTVFALFLWIAGFPIYLSKRQSLIDRATTHPVEVKRRWLKLAIICLFGALGVYGTLDDSARDERVASRPSPGERPQNVPAPRAPAIQPTPVPATTTPRPFESATSTASKSTTPQEKPVSPQTASIARSEVAAPSSPKSTPAALSSVKVTTSAPRVQMRTDDTEETRLREASRREAEATSRRQATTSNCVYKPVMTDEDIAKCR